MGNLSRRQIHLGAYGDRWTDFESLVQLAHAAERGLFDFVLGGPDTVTALSALAGVTDRLGLVGTVDTAVAEPSATAKRFATLDHLSDGRSGWHIDSFPDGDGAARTQEFVAVVHALWGSWEPGAVRDDERTGIYVDPERIRAVEHEGAHFDVRGAASVPPRWPGPPVMLVFNRFPIATFGWGDIGGTAERIADEMDSRVQADACDGFILVPPTPRALDEFVDTVVPLLQERGAFRTEYVGRTLREHLRP